MRVSDDDLSVALGFLCGAALSILAHCLPVDFHRYCFDVRRERVLFESQQLYQRLCDAKTRHTSGGPVRIEDLVG